MPTALQEEAVAARSPPSRDGAELAEWNKTNTEPRVVRLASMAAAAA
jgi:hypothetical protein